MRRRMNVGVQVVTILYALVGIPLMFIYMANIGTILATSFKYTYSKMCRLDIFSRMQISLIEGARKTQKNFQRRQLCPQYPHL